MTLLHEILIIVFFFRNSASSETIDTTGSNFNLEVGIKERLDNLDQANTEIDRLRKIIEKLTGELQGKTYYMTSSKGKIIILNPRR